MRFKITGRELKVVVGLAVGMASFLGVVTHGAVAQSSVKPFWEPDNEAGVSTPSRLFDPAATCQEITTWIAEFRDELPTTLDELSTYPLSYRRAIYGALSLGARTSLWSEHLRSVLLAEPGLRAEQKQLVVEVLYSLERYMVEDASGHELREDLRKRAEGLFGADFGREVFATLGPLSLSAEALGVQCSCSVDSDWCNSGYECFTGGCDVTNFGCGTLWLYSCNGSCWGLF